MELANYIFKKNDNLAWRIIDGEAFIIHPKDGLIYPLNRTATRIWELVDGKNSVSELVAKIEEEFEEDKEVIEKDIDSFLKDLLKTDLIVKVENNR
ncbi:MAG: PqqD family protein [Candidatus Omnitrophica bacterium]|nr:PqqD family protein [Candidatus Omnitrophota bacterium]MCM8771105.1 PqqD family protein [Candidatus Omnitrophota bacterium]